MAITSKSSGDAAASVDVDAASRGGLSSAQAWYAVFVLTVANISGAIDRQIFSSLGKGIKRDLQLSDTQLSLLAGFGFVLFFSIFGVLIGRLVDRRKRNVIVALGAAIWSVMTVLTGLTKSYGQLMLARVGVGVGEATLSPAAVSIIADAFPRRRLGTAMSVYMIGIFAGSGFSYAFGGWLASRWSDTSMVTVPLFGAVHPWQTVFFVIGLPGLAVAALALTMPEPKRTAGDRALEQVPIPQVIAYLRRNARTMIALCAGFMCSASVNWGMGFWLISFFTRTHGWSLAKAATLQGTLTALLGPIGVVFGGWLVDRFAKRGMIDAPLRVGIIGAVGMLVLAGLYPVLPSATMAAWVLVPVNIFAAMPWGAANVAIAEAMPSRMRGQGGAVFQLILGLSGGIGPTAVALVTDKIFGNEQALRWSLMWVTIVGMSLAIAILSWGLPAYRATVAARDAARESSR